MREYNISVLPIKTLPPPSHSLLALLGYTSIVLTSIVFLVILVEFDPEGHHAKHPENSIEGTLRRSSEGYVLETMSGQLLPLLRMEHPRIPENASMTAYKIPEIGRAIPEYALPHVPRSTTDLLLVIGVLIVSMILVAADPRIAYFDIFDHE